MSKTKRRKPMSDDSIDFSLNNVSVVILAQTHNPAIVNPDFLKKHKIAENEWEIVVGPSLLLSPGLALISFKNGVQWQVDPNNLTIQEGVGGDFKESYLIYKSAERYVKVLEHVPYTALGLNWHFDIRLKEEDLLNWMRNRFLKEGEWRNEIEPSSFAFKILPSWTLTLSSVRVEELTLKLDCNYHTNIASEDNKVEKICSVLGDLSDHQESLKKIREKYFEEKLS